MSFFSVRDASSFLFRSSKFSTLSHCEAPSKSLQGFTLCFQFLFLFIILILPEFFMEALHGGSSRILFILHLFFKIFSELRSAKLYSKINMVFNTCFVLRSSSILHLAFQIAILSILSLAVVLCHFGQFLSCFMIRKVSGMSYLNPSFSSLELSWYKFHLKPSIGNVALCDEYL